jgi:hypothetical protein
MHAEISGWQQDKNMTGWRFCADVEVVLAGHVVQYIANVLYHISILTNCGSSCQGQCLKHIVCPQLLYVDHDNRTCCQLQRGMAQLGLCMCSTVKAACKVQHLCPACQLLTQPVGAPKAPFLRILLVQKSHQQLGTSLHCATFVGPKCVQVISSSMIRVELANMARVPPQRGNHQPSV